MRVIPRLTLVFCLGLFLISAAVRAGDKGENAAPAASVKKGVAILSVPTHFPSTAVALTANGKLLAASSSENTVKVWDVVSGKELHTLKGHSVSVITLAFSPDGKTLASATGSWGPDGAPGEVKLWDVVTGKERRSLAKLPTMVIALAFSPDGKILASASETVKLWDVENGTEKMELQVRGGTTWSLAFAPDGRSLATGVGKREDNTPGLVILWDVVTGKERATLAGHIGMVSCVGFTPDGKALASADSKGTVKLWNVANAEERTTIRNPHGFFSFQAPLAFTADGKTLVSALVTYDVQTEKARTIVRQWKVATGNVQASFYPPLSSEGFMALSADGKRLALNGVEQRDGKLSGVVNVWDVQSLATSPPKFPDDPETPAANVSKATGQSLLFKESSP